MPPKCGSRPHRAGSSVFMMLFNGYSNLEVKPSEIQAFIRQRFLAKLSPVMTHSDDLKEKDQATRGAAPVRRRCPLRARSVARGP